MKHVSNLKFAQICGVSETSIRRARASGAIVIEPDGLIDPLRSENIAYQTAKKLDPSAGVQAAPASSQRISSAGRPSVSRQSTPSSGEPPNSLLDLRYRREAALTAEKELKNQKTRGALLEQHDVTVVLNKIWAVHASELIPLASKLPPEIASLMGVEDTIKVSQVRARLDEEFWKILASIKRVMTDFIDLEDDSNKEKKCIP